MNRKIFIPIAALLALLAVGMILIKTGPEPKRRPVKKVIPVVEGMVATQTDYQVFIPTRGTVSARTESDLLAQVGGRIVYVSDKLRSGGFFENGDVLARIESVDYQRAVTIAKADVANAVVTMEEEKAISLQAENEWKALSMEGEPDDLTLRRPQLARAKANLMAAKARLGQAETDLTRTVIVAPYAGRALTKRADLGQFVGRGQSLGKIYAIDYVEVRLPVTDKQIGYLDLPTSYRGESNTDATPLSKVTLIANVGDSEYKWDGVISRSEGAIDARTRQLFVIAQVKDPYGKRADGQPPLKVGQFVEAKIEGRLIKDVFVLPRKAMTSDTTLIVISPEKKISRRNISIAWRDENNILVTGGLKTGEMVMLTRLAFAPDGMEVALFEDRK